MKKWAGEGSSGPATVNVFQSKPSTSLPQNSDGLREPGMGLRAGKPFFSAPATKDLMNLDYYSKKPKQESDETSKILEKTREDGNKLQEGLLKLKN